jgi:AraC-like DNA-binding protein
MEPNYKFYFKNEFRPLASLSLYEVASFDCPAGYVLPIEKPDAFALYYVAEGKGSYTLSGTEYSVGEGDIFAMYPDTDVMCKADKQEPWSLMAVSFNGADSRIMMNAAQFDVKAPVRHLDENTGELAAQCITGVYKYRGQDIFGAIQSTATLYLLMSLLVRTATWDQSAMPPGWTGVVHFHKALKFIEDNYSKPVGVKEIADHVNLSRSRLYRLFLQHIFIPPQQYLAEYRIREARILLENRESSVKEIANAVGIEDPVRFSRLFKQLTGKSPVKYMKDLIEYEKNKVMGE